MGTFGQALTRMFTRPAKAGAVRSGMDVAGGGRRWGNNPTVPRIGAATLAGHSVARDRARYACTSDPLAANALSILTTGLVGYGMTFASAHPNADTRRRIDKAFKRFSQETNFPAAEAAMVQSLVRDGESVSIMAVSDAGELDLQPVPSELLDSSLSRDLPNGRYIAGGVEFGANNRPDAYHISPQKPTALFAGYAPPTRFDAEDTIHVFRQLSPDQPRGLSWFAPVLLGLSDLNQALDALGVTVKIQAMLTGFLLDQNGAGQGSPFADGTPGDLSEVSLEPGTIRVLPPGWDIRFSAPAQMAQSIEFAQLSMRTLAAGLQIPDFLFSGDMRNANYSSMRSALVAFRQHLESVQFLTLIPQFHTRVFRRWLTLEVLSGRLDFPDFEENRDDYFAAEWYPPAVPWVDPSKDAQATAAMIEAGLMSRRQAVSALGFNIEILDEEIRADRAREAALGLQFGDFAKPKGGTDAD